MTLGCGAPGGNITSDNIGPLHLINVKRIAWEARPVEHRSIPASERMAEQSQERSVAPPVNQALVTAEAKPGSVCARANPQSPASQIAAEIAGRVFSAAAGRQTPQAAPSLAPAPPSPAPEKPALAVMPFVSESDVRLAVSRGEKILLGARSIVTPSARDLGNEHDIFIETEAS
jgi:acetaldehyde dehydrogenase (acetylating)